jgi:membrane protein required for beta-lactamase induction
MTPVLHSPGRLATAAVPVLGFLLTPLLPFVNGVHLWFGLPSVLVWTALCVLATVGALRLVEASYLRAGGRALDEAEEDEPGPEQGTLAGVTDGRETVR